MQNSTAPWGPQKKFWKDFDFFLSTQNGKLSSRELRLKRPNGKDSNVVDMKKDDNELYLILDPLSLRSFECVVIFLTRPYTDNLNAGRRPCVQLARYFQPKMNGASLVVE